MRSRSRTDETIDADIVICGSGMGGMSAAVTAAEEGANVVVLEKQSILGGGTNFAEGVFGMGSDLQKEAGVTGDLKELIAIEMEFQRHIVDYTLWEFVAEGAEENLVWLMDHGVEFVELGQPALRRHPYPAHVRGSSRQQHDRKTGGGRTRPRRGHPRLKRRACICSPTTTRWWAQAESDGKVINVNAKAVILATGSAGENEELFQQYTSRVAEKVICGAARKGSRRRHPHGMRSGMGEPFRLMAPIVGTTVEPLGVASHLASLGAMNPYALWVNQNGIRFTDEGLTRAYTTSVNAVESQIKTFSIVDQNLFDRLVQEGDMNVGWGYYVNKGTALSDAPKELERELKANSENVFKADTIDELAKQMGIDPATLKNTVEEYNALVDSGADTLHGKKPEYLAEVRTGPFYGFRVKGSKVNMFGASTSTRTSKWFARTARLFRTVRRRRRVRRVPR